MKSFPLNIKKGAHRIWGCAHDSIKAMLADKKTAFICMAAEMLFLVTIGFVSSSFIDRIKASIISLGAILAGGGVSDSVVLASDGLLDLIVGAGGGAYLIRIGVLFSLLMLCTYALWCLFHGFIWVHIYKLLGVKTEPTIIFRRFTQVSILWVMLYYLQRCIFFVASFFATLKTKDPTTLNNDPIMLSMLILIVYFGFISYTQIGSHKALKSIRNAFSIGVFKAGRPVSGILSLVVLFIALNYVLIGAEIIHPSLLIVGGTLLVIPVMTWARVFFTSWVKKSDEAVHL